MYVLFISIFMAIESKMMGRPVVGSSRGYGTESAPKKFPWKLIIGILILVVVAFSVWYYFGRVKKTDVLGDLTGSGAPVIATGEYQAIFLDNTQVYFGKLERSTSDFYILTDVFYLQAGASTVSPQGNLSLSKLGSEAHGPEDKMEINKSHVLFIENMKADSKVVQAIQQYKSNKK